MKLHAEEYIECHGIGRHRFLDDALKKIKELVISLDIPSKSLERKAISKERLLGYELSKTDLRRGSLTFSGATKGRSLIVFGASDLDHNVGYVSVFPREWLGIVMRVIDPVDLLGDRLIFGFRINNELKTINTARSIGIELGMKREDYSFIVGPTGLEEIDHFSSPFRVFRRERYVEAVGTEMWLGSRFWETTGARKEVLQRIKGITINDVEGVTHVRVNQEFLIQDADVDLARDLRKCLYPESYNRDEAGGLRADSEMR